MYLFSLFKFNFNESEFLTKMIRIMKLTIILLIAACLQVSAKGYSQKITIKENNVPLQKVFEEIRRQTDYDFLYVDEVLKTAQKVSLNIEKGSIEDVLDVCFKNQQLSYIISGNTIIVQRKTLVPKVNASLSSPSSVYSPTFIKASEEFTDANEIREKLINTAIQIKGKIIDDKGQPLMGATILVKGTDLGTKSDLNGTFSINAEPNSTLIISFVGFESTEVKIGNQPPFSAQGYLDLHRDYLTQFNPNLPYGYYFQPDQLPADVTIDQWRNMSANPASQRCG